MSLRIPGRRISAKKSTNLIRRASSRTDRASGSGSTKYAAMPFTAARAAATYAGSESECCERKPPIAGPSTKPRPNAAPMIPIPFARPSGGVTSATNARAMAMFAVAAPANNRETRRMANVEAAPYIANASAVIAIETSSTGRLPIRSERRPQIGANTNCMSE